MKFIEKLRNLPESKKVIIFFVVMGIAALVCGFIGMRLVVSDFSKVTKAGLGINLPKIEIPEALKNLGGANQPKTVELKTYTSETYGYEVKYPAGFTVAVSKTGEATFSNDSNAESAAADINVIPNTKEQYDVIKKDNQHFDKCEKVVLPELDPLLEVIRCEYKEAPKQAKGGYVYEIFKPGMIVWANIYQNVPYDALLDEMMKTFKFVK